MRLASLVSAFALYFELSQLLSAGQGLDVSVDVSSSD
jgi:hypothetical protein